MQNRAFRGCFIFVFMFTLPDAGFAKSNHPSVSPTELTQPNEQSRRPNTSEPASDKRGTDEIPLTVKILPSKKTESEAAKEEYESLEKPQLDRGLTAYTGWLVVFTAALFFVAACQVGLFFWQLRIMRVGLRDTAEAALAAKESAKAARDSVELAGDTAKRQLRAYVCISGANISFENKDTPVVHIVAKNCGLTPAYEVRQWSHIWIEEHPLRIVLPAPPDGFKTGVAILPPNGSHDMIQSRNPIPADGLRLIGTPAGTIYVYGEIKYNDAFKQPHVTRYRLIFGGPEGAREGRLQPDTHGNDAD